MRQILFRGKRVDGGGWVEGVPVYAGGETFIMENDLHWLPSAEENVFTEVIPETIGQYTGLKDKNGVMIFEGDRLLVDTEDEEIEFVVKWIDSWSGFAFVGNTPKDTELPEDWPGVSVVNSIHDTESIEEG